jgi:hypothetical protein
VQYMKKFIEMPYESKKPILVAVDIPDNLEDEPTDVGFLDFFKPKKVKINYQTISQAILDYSKPIIDSFEVLGNGKVPPKKATVEFGLSFNGTGNIYLVEASMEATMKVSLEWELGGREIVSKLP